MRPTVLPQPKCSSMRLRIDLAQRVTGMARGATVNRAAAATGVVARDMRRDLALAARGNEVRGVVGFVRADAAATGAGHRVEHRQRRRALADAIGVRHHRAHHQARSGSPSAHALGSRGSTPCCGSCEQSARRDRSCSRGCRCCAACPSSRLARCAHRPPGRLIVAAVLRPKALVARPRLNQRAVDREVFLGQQPRGIGQAHAPR